MTHPPHARMHASSPAGFGFEYSNEAFKPSLGSDLWNFNRINSLVRKHILGAAHPHGPPQMCAPSKIRKISTSDSTIRFEHTHTHTPYSPSSRSRAFASLDRQSSHSSRVLTARCGVRVYYFVGCLSNGTNRRRHFQFTISMYTQIPNWKRIAHRRHTEQHNGAFCNEKFTMHRHPHRHAHNKSTDKLGF